MISSNLSLRSIGTVSALAALAAAPLAEAAVTVSALSEITVGEDQSVGIDIDGDGNDDFTVATTIQGVTITGRTAAEQVFIASPNEIRLFDEDDELNAALDATNELTFSTTLLLVSDAYIGFTFTNNEGSYVGWLQGSGHAEPNWFTIHSAAWETDSSSIQVGAVPEPSATLLLFPTLAGCFVLRRSRRA